VRETDAATAAFALARARATSPLLARWDEAIGTGRDISRLSPLRRDTAGTGAGLARLGAGVDRATRNLRVLVRRVLFALGDGDPLPGALPALLDDLAAALEGLDVAEPAASVERLVGLGALLDPAVLGGSLSASVVVGQLRSAVVDLLEACGVDPARARAALPPAR
jgi:hypothetical protein